MRIRFRATTGGDKRNEAQATSWKLKQTAPLRYDIGECIYCSSAQELTNEHTLPYSIWGNGVLVGASCKHCQTLIQPQEQYVLRYLWRKPRELLGAPTRKAKKTGDWTGDAKIYDDEGCEILVPVAHALPLLLTPYYAGIPVGLNPKEERPASKELAVTVLTNAGAEVSRYTTDDLFISHRRFARVAVKIAYSEYILRFNPAFRSAAVSAFICRDEGDPVDFCRAVQEDKPDECLHFVGFKAMRCDGDPTSDRLACRLRLFSFLGVPTFFIDLGPIDVASEPTDLAIGHV